MSFCRHQVTMFCTEPAIVFWAVSLGAFDVPHMLLTGDLQRIAVSMIL